VENEHDDLTTLLDSAAAALASGVTRLRKATSGEEPGLDGWAAEVRATYERLLLRVSAEDPVAVAYKAARDRLTDLAELLASARDAPSEKTAVDAFEQARNTYLDQARVCLADKAPTR
jgi:hypothetical protein